MAADEAAAAGDQHVHVHAMPFVHVLGQQVNARETIRSLCHFFTLTYSSCGIRTSRFRGCAILAPMREHVPMARLQEADYGAGRDYAYGSPHLTHPQATARIDEQLRRLVADLVEEHGRCRVVEVGAGHGTFTETLLAAGASVAVTEMSAPSAAVLTEKFAGNTDVTVVHDPDGTAAADLVAAGCEALVYVSVLHHIPDYLEAVGRAGRRDAGGQRLLLDHGPDLVSRPDTSHPPRRAGQGYLAWRIAQGNLRRGLVTRWRRLRHGYGESEPVHMVEFHTVRQGVDQHALAHLLETHFADVELDEYWSTQGRFFQRLGERTSLACTFGITARHHT